MERVEDGLQPGSQVLSAEELRALDAFWRAADDLSVGQICLLDNPRLRESSGSNTANRGCSATGGRVQASTSLAFT